MADPVEICPKCGSTCIVRVANMKVCNQCSATLDLVLHPIAEAARARKAQQGNWPGWRRPEKT